MNNNLDTLNQVLFEQLNRLSDRNLKSDKLRKEIERSFMNKFMKKLAYFLDKQGYFLLNISVISKKYGTEFNKIYRK